MKSPVLLHSREQLLYPADRKPYTHFHELNLIHEDGTVLYMGGTDKGDSFGRVGHMQYVLCCFLKGE
jgi:hypothetical protein